MLKGRPTWLSVRLEGNKHDLTHHASQAPNEAEAPPPGATDPGHQKGNKENYRPVAIVPACQEAEVHPDHLVKAQYVAVNVVVVQVLHVAAEVEAAVLALVVIIAVVEAEAEAIAIIVVVSLL